MLTTKIPLLGRNLFCLLLFSLLSITVFAQTKVNGKITAPDGKPLSGATVAVNGASQGTTDETGSFSVTAKNGDQISVSMIGYETATATYSGQSSLDLQLRADVSGLNEVVVTGYGTQRRRNVTGAIASVNSRTLNELPNISVSQALQGRVAGVTVTNNGSPGTQPIVRIRGISSISYASDPLYVIDGFPTGDLASFDMRDIESVDILKDASAAAIYGSRATNGVVMITTKKGRRDNEVRVNLDSYFGFQEVTKRIDLLDREGFEKYAIAYRGSQVPRLLPPDRDMPIYQGAPSR